MKTWCRILRIAFVTAAAAYFVRCGLLSPPGDAGNSTQTGNPSAVAGILYQPDGKTPASGVRVVIRPRATLADTSGTFPTMRIGDTATVLTDDSGYFAFDTTLNTGTYVIEAADGNNAVLIDSVAVQDPDSTLHLPPDTLKPAGALKGVIRLSEGGDPRKVFVLAFGIDRFARVEADGRFRFQNLAEARYDLRLISSLDDYGVLDTFGVPVTSSDTTDLDTVYLPFLGIPTPKGFIARYDTLHGVVVLSWNRTAYPDLQGYVIYRNDTTSTLPEVISGSRAILDTFFLDTVFGSPSDTTTSVFDYRARIQSKNAMLSENYSAPVRVVAVSPMNVRTYLYFGTVNTLNDTASINDTLGIVLNFRNPTRPSRTVKWYVDNGSRDSSVHTKQISVLEGTDTLWWVWKSEGKKNVFAEVIDASGAVWTDSLAIEIVQDIPVITISGYSTIPKGMPITFAAEVVQKFGTIEKYRWDNGIQAGFDDSTGPAYSCSFPSETTLVVRVEAIDDDGNVGVGTKTVVITFNELDSSSRGTILCSRPFLMRASQADPLTSLYDGNGTHLNLSVNDTIQLTVENQMVPRCSLIVTPSTTLEDLVSRISIIAMNASGGGSTTTLNYDGTISITNGGRSIVGLTLSNGSKQILADLLPSDIPIGKTVSSGRILTPVRTEAVEIPDMFDSLGRPLGLETRDEIGINGKIGGVTIAELRGLYLGPSDPEPSDRRLAVVRTLTDLRSLISEALGLPDTVDGRPSVSVWTGPSEGEETISQGSIVIGGRPGSRFGVTDLSIVASNSDGNTISPAYFNANMTFRILQTARD